MASRSIFLVMLSLSVCFSAVRGFAPDPLKDYDIPGKKPSEVVAADFMSKGFRDEPVVPPGEAAMTIPLFGDQFPGLNTQGIAVAKFRINPCGVNPPHVHPRATEVLTVIRGTIYAAFIDTNNKVFANVLHAGDTQIFPRGLVHFYGNIGKTPGRGFAFFNSQNPGTTRVAPALFRSKDAMNHTIPSSILASVYGITPAEVEALKMSVPTGFALGNKDTGCPGHFHHLV